MNKSEQKQQKEIFFPKLKEQRLFAALF